MAPRTHVKASGSIRDLETPVLGEGTVKTGDPGVHQLVLRSMMESVAFCGYFEIVLSLPLEMMLDG